MRRRPSLMVGVAVIVLLVAAIAGGQVVAAQLGQGPEQPVAFNHVTHAGVLQISCTFCHRNVTEGATASVPAVQQCMFCHSVVKEGDEPGDAMEIAKVREAFDAEMPIDWLRVHRVPDHVRFIHEAHIKALSKMRPGVPTATLCATCHGQVAEMSRVRQVRPLKMGDCVACHRVNDAPTDCTTCHK